MSIFDSRICNYVSVVILYCGPRILFVGDFGIWDNSVLLYCVVLYMIFVFSS